MCKLVPQFLSYRCEILHLTKKLLIGRNSRYRTTIYCMENFFIWRGIFTKFGMDYFLKQKCNLRRNWLDHYSQPTAIQTKRSESSACKEPWICEGYYSFGKPEVKVFSSFGNKLARFTNIDPQLICSLWYGKPNRM